jgi:hypothetical protein
MDCWRLWNIVLLTVNHSEVEQFEEINSLGIWYWTEYQLGDIVVLLYSSVMIYSRAL